MSEGGIRFYLAPDDPMLEPSPSWTLVSEDGLAVSAVQISRGRADEFNRTNPGSASVTLKDRSGVFDPTNVASDWYGTIQGIQARVDLYNPVADSWATIFRGFTADFSTVADRSQRLLTHTVPLEDALAYLARAECQPGDGNTIPAGSDAVGNVFYDNASVQDRLAAVIADSGFPTDLTIIFTGNIDVQESVYDPGTSFLSIAMEAAEAEFPDVAVLCVDRRGRVTFHGRYSRFDPDGVSSQPGVDWPFRRWAAGDEAAFLDDSDRAQIRVLEYANPMSYVFNKALAFPKDMTNGKLASQVRSDTTSIGQYGVQNWRADDLIILEATTTLNSPAVECQAYSQYIVDNYAQPKIRPSTLGFKAINPGDDRAAPVWALLCGVDINDIVGLTVGNPGGGGFAGDEFFVEGVQYNIRPANDSFAMIDLTVNVSPQGYYNTFS